MKKQNTFIVGLAVLVAITIATWLALVAPMYTGNEINMTRGVSSLANTHYDLHMTILWICVVIGILVFTAMFTSIVLHRKSVGHEPAQFSHSTKAEIAWTVIPVLILIYVLVNNYSPMMAGFVAVLSTFTASLIANAVRWTVSANQLSTDNPARKSLYDFGRNEFKQIIGSLEKGARNAIMVSVACAAAGIIVGMVTLTGMGLKFSSLVLDLSFGIKALAILLIGAASLVLGMGLPVTASYIVLATLAGPALLDMGVPILVTHMIVFWYSQDANVTPPVCLAAYSAAGISGSRPLETGIESWKLAKGIYIIPLLFVYTPILFEGPLWQVLETAAAALLGLFCAAVMFEGFHLVALNWGLRLAYLAAAVLLLWPLLALHAAGAVLLAALVVAQKVIARKPVEEKAS